MVNYDFVLKCYTMKLILLILFVSFAGIISAQTNLQVITPIQASLGKKLVGRSGFALDDSGRVYVTYMGIRNGSNYTPTDIALLSLGSDSIWQEVNIGAQGGPSTNYLTGIEFKNGSLWMGSDKGLIRKTGSAWKVFNQYPNKPDTVINFVIKGSTYCLLTNNGVKLCYNNLGFANWVDYGFNSGILPNFIYRAIDIDLKGIIWLASKSGVVRFDPTSNEVKIFNKENSDFLTDAIWAIKVLPNGEVWAGTDPNSGQSNFEKIGLYRFNGSGFKAVFSETGFCSLTLLPINGFRQIYSEGNQICFPSKTKYHVFDGAGNFTWTKTDGTKFEFYDMSPYIHTANSYLVVKHKDRTYFIGNGDSRIISILPNELTKFDPKTLWKDERDSTGSSFDKEDYNELNINNLSVPIAVKGDLFLMDKDGFTNLSAKSALCKRLSYSSSLWMGGMVDNNLYVAAGTYRQTGRDYGQGPLKIGLASSDSKTRFKFSKIWKLDERVINEFKENFSKPNYLIPEPILTWPAHGDSISGYAARLAPFIDVNNNGKYEPNLGDYPKISGQQNLFWIFNDSTLIHSESEGDPLGVEVQANTYAYVCDEINDLSENKAVNNTFFVKYKLINRSNRTYTNFNAGIWMDVSMGDYTNDRLGSNPKEEYVFCYNDDTLDAGIMGFGKQLPAYAVVMLKGFKDINGQIGGAKSLLSYNNDFSPYGNPSRPMHFYHYLQGKWKNGMPITYGGTGYNGSDSQNVWMFPGENDLLNRPNWSEENSQIPRGDRRFLLTTQNVTLKPGDEQEIEFALVYTPTQSNQKQFILGQLHQDVLKVKDWYRKQDFPSCSNLPLSLQSNEKYVSESLFILYPNPSNGNLQVLSKSQASLVNVSVYDLGGKQVYSKNNPANDEIFELSFLKPGLYFVKLQSNETVQVLKWLKD
jgi:hypothetical protein